MGAGRSVGSGEGREPGRVRRMLRLAGVSWQRSASVAEQVTQQAEVGRVSESKPAELSLPEPSDGVMLFRLQVRDAASPTARDPHGEVQVGLRVDSVQDGAALGALQFGPQLLSYLPPQRVLGVLARQDVTAGEVPHVRVPPPPRQPVA